MRRSHLQNQRLHHRDLNPPFADVIFSNDFKVVLNVTELGFDPIEYTQEKVRDGFRQALDQLKNR